MSFERQKTKNSPLKRVYKYKMLVTNHSNLDKKWQDIFHGDQLSSFEAP